MAWFNKANFKNYEKLSFDFTNETIEDDLLRLNEIFSTQRRTSEKIALVNDYGEEGLKFFKWIKKGNICFYRYMYELPIVPTSEEDMDILGILIRWSKSRNSDTVFSYWNAYKFFVRRGYVLNKRDNTSTYMGLSEGNNNRFLIKNHRGFKYHDYFEMYNDDYVIGNTTVKCGRMDFGRIILELAYGKKSLWIFPHNKNFEMGERNYSYCYLMEVNEDLTFYTPKPFMFEF